MELVDSIVGYLSGHAVWWGLVVVMISAGVEYIFPPFPGDSVTLVAAVLIPTAQWPLVGVFLAVMLGSLGGCALNWWVGNWLYRNPDSQKWYCRWLHRPKIAERIEAIKEQFRRRGPWFIVSNRFVPAFRGLFFIASGMAGLRLGPVLGWAALSAALWNGAILAVGSAVGYNLEALVSIMENYRYAFFAAAGLALVLWALRTFVLSRREDTSSGPWG